MLSIENFDNGESSYRNLHLVETVEKTNRMFQETVPHLILNHWLASRSILDDQQLFQSTIGRVRGFSSSKLKIGGMFPTSACRHLNKLPIHRLDFIYIEGVKGRSEADCNTVHKYFPFPVVIFEKSSYKKISLSKSINWTASLVPEFKSRKNLELKFYGADIKNNCVNFPREKLPIKIYSNNDNFGFAVYIEDILSTPKLIHELILCSPRLMIENRDYFSLDNSLSVEFYPMLRTILTKAFSKGHNASSVNFVLKLNFVSCMQQYHVVCKRKSSNCCLEGEQRIF